MATSRGWSPIAVTVLALAAVNVASNRLVPHAWYVPFAVASAAMLLLMGMIALPAGPVYAQIKPNLMPELPSKTPEEKEADAVRERAYKESLKKIPDAKTSSDPWGSVRSAETPRPAAPAKSRTKTGSTAN